ncbi:hypothetical protein [Psychrobacter piechaudii]|uniref:Uncharacterized protein n=1 Tax=Psychrobacter piechaudii TaxID=1945521 RepID=A0A1R4GRB8_9GAMM|nr:hypothetical protein [Psychrobacter piechaudii]SJM70736.1 hypothetical protein A1232T_01053 [Psychrobacter piechaudii]
MNKNLDNPKPKQDLRIYGYVGLAIIILYGAAYYLFPDTLPRGSFDIVIGVTLLVSELLKAFKGSDYYFLMMVFAAWITFNGLEEVLNLDRSVGNTFLMIMGGVLLIKFLHNAVKGKYEP